MTFDLWNCDGSRLGDAWLEGQVNVTVGSERWWVFGRDASFSCFSLKEADGQDRGHSCSSASELANPVWRLSSCHLIGHLCNFLNADWSWDSCLLYRSSMMPNSSKITKFTWCNQIKPTSRSVETSPVRGIMRQTVEYYYRPVCVIMTHYTVCVCVYYTMRANQWFLWWDSTKDFYLQSLRTCSLNSSSLKLTAMLFINKIFYLNSKWNFLRQTKTLFLRWQFVKSTQNVFSLTFLYFDDF